MKKILTITLAFCFLLTGCSTKGTISDATAAQAMEKLNNKETMIVVLGSTTCSACKQYKEVTDEVVSEHEVSIVDVWVDKEPLETVNGRDVKVDLMKLFESVGTITHTPTILFIVEGEVKERMVGAISYSETVRIAKETGIIK